MASTIKVDTIDTPSGAGDITISRPIVATLTAGSINNLNNLLTPANASVTAAKMATTDTLPAWNGSALTNVVPADNSVTGAKINLSLLAGDTMYASATDTLAKLAKGTDGEVMTLASGVPSWAAAAGGGKLLSCKQFVKTDTASTTSTTAVSTGLAITTDTLTTGSKVLVQVSAHIGNSTTEQRSLITLWNGATQLFLGDAGTGHRVSSFFRSMDPYSLYNISFMYLHSPGVTAAQTYTLKYHRSANTSFTCWINRGNGEDANSGRAASSITAMEIGV